MNFFTQLLRKYNFRGKWRLVNALLKNHVKVVIPYKENTLIEVDTSELIGWNVYWNGGYENEVMWILDYVVKKGDVAIDFGANLGIWSLVLASKCAEVHSVEPHPDFRAKLENNLYINRFSNTRIHPYAISLKEGEATLFAPP